MDTANWKHVSPPIPVTSTEDSQRGQVLLAQVRSMEKEDNKEEFVVKSEQVAQSMKLLIAVYCRQGLLQGDAKKAEEILGGSSIHESSFNQQDTLKKKRGRQRDDRNTSKAPGDSTGSAATDESLTISAVLRILSMQTEKLQASLFLVRLAADLSTAVAEHIKSSSTTRINLAELELLTASGIPLLKALSKASKHVLSVIFPLFLPESESPAVLLGLALGSESESIAALVSCLRATSTLVALFGNKLSRSIGLLSDLRRIGLTALTCPQDDIQYAAAKMTAALPLSGALQDKKGGPNKSSSEQWSHFLMDSVTALSKVLSTMAPFNLNMDVSASSWKVSNPVGELLDNLVIFFQRDHVMDEERRSSACRSLVHGFSMLVISLLKRDDNDATNELMLMDAQLPLEDIFRLLESMLSFAYASETTYNTTKKRLRSERIEGGLVSPVALVADIAGYVKLMGHKIFNTLLGAVGYPPLLPHSKQISQMASGTMLSSSSTSLRRVVDPSKVGSQLDGKRVRWIHTSIALRTEAIRSFTATISLFGLEPARSKISGTSAWAPSQKSSSAEQSITLVGGSLLEQLRWNGKQSVDWGTSIERGELALVAIKSLETILVSCGGFMPFAVRALVDSITAACLQTIISPGGSILAATQSTKVAVLQLGAACLSTPWPIGTSSSILEYLRKCAQQCQMDDTNTSTVAASVLRLCDCMATPRVPALHVDTQRHDHTIETSNISAISLIKDIQKADIEQEEGAAQSVKQKEEQEIMRELETQEKEAKKRKVIEDTESKARKKFKESKASEMAVKRKAEVVAESIPTQNALQPSVKENSDEKAAQVAVEEKEVTMEDEEEMDFLPGIVDDDGPDEDDV